MSGFVMTFRRTKELATVVLLNAALLPNWAMGQSAGVHGLTQAGWTIVKQVEKQEVRSGVSPYADLQRVVSITEYHLEKDGQTMICRMSYDSQQDTQEEKCE
tara:strand:+ start:1268 stop:1573 length:306 start_codon:yes stop_codon:yes gene_type:complete